MAWIHFCEREFFTIGMLFKLRASDWLQFCSAHHAHHKIKPRNQLYEYDYTSSSIRKWLNWTYLEIKDVSFLQFYLTNLFVIFIEHGSNAIELVHF